ncbi:hypothetical protein ACLB2K_050753 [Fragaria x ananassa]
MCRTRWTILLDEWNTEILKQQVEKQLQEGEMNVVVTKKKFEYEKDSAQRALRRGKSYIGGGRDRGTSPPRKCMEQYNLV